MRHGHEISPAWRGAPWNRRAVPDWTPVPSEGAEAPRMVVPLALSVLLGLALGATIVAGLAREDRARFDRLMTATRAG